MLLIWIRCWTISARISPENYRPRADSLPQVGTEAVCTMHVLPVSFAELLTKLNGLMLLAQEQSVVPLKDLWLEILITAAMIGWVLFAVCRSSPRN